MKNDNTTWRKTEMFFCTQCRLPRLHKKSQRVKGYDKSCECGYTVEHTSTYDRLENGEWIPIRTTYTYFHKPNIYYKLVERNENLIQPWHSHKGGRYRCNHKKDAKKKLQSGFRRKESIACDELVKSYNTFGQPGYCECVEMFGIECYQCKFTLQEHKSTQMPYSKNKVEFDMW